MKQKIGIVLDLRRGLGQKIIGELQHVFHDDLDYELFYTDDMKSMKHCDLVLVMIKEKILEVLDYIDDPKKVLTIKRTLDMKSLNRLRQVSASDVLVVNDNEETTLNLVITLHRLGLDHINWIPFYRDGHYDTTVAVTANESHLVPNGHDVIDIGFRPLDVSSLVDIIVKLGLKKNYHDALLTYQRENVPIDPSVLDQLGKNIEMKKLEHVLKTNNQISGHQSYYSFDDIVFESKEMQEMLIKASKLAVHDINVLIVGESGTGKELVAQGIHSLSYRRDLPFLGVNVTAIPNNLLESELFGYVPGAFTGASKQGHKGLFEQCHGGTIFLDEIGDLPLDLQGKLLRVLEEQSIRPIGSKNLIKINVRVLAATNKDILQEIDKGNFREDLYYRLKASVLILPPLRMRSGDIKVLMNKFIGDNYFIEHDVINLFSSYPWKGNVRELKHACEYAKIMATNGRITLSDLPDDMFTSTLGQAYFNLDKMYDVMNAIHTLSKSNTSVGRDAIRNYLEDTLGISEIKSILKHLKDEGYILQGRGRKGSVLTKKGEMYLDSNVQ